MTTILCLTAFAKSASLAPFIVMSVMRLEILPISVWVFFITLIPSRYGYSVFGSKPLRSFSCSLDTILTLLFEELQGITITVSPSKSAPDNLSATLLFIPMASLGVFPNIFCASRCLLFTFNIGISKVPP